MSASNHLAVPSYPLSIFSIQKGMDNSKRLVTEASTMSGFSQNIWNRLYKDAMDVGFSILSPKTNQNARFYLSETNWNLDNEITSWTFEPCDKKLDGKVYVVVFND